ncbi:MAG TPA: tetratricopeptide repeat protein [Candidatus Acidoferrales bacterium]|jgi:tetratricopeptide (TPR) repeat protein|nr:tetratricopeptide repeat protein [Candidatus Acidoferrales bacterium]
MIAPTRHSTWIKVLPATLFICGALLCPITQAADKEKKEKPEKEKKEKIEPWVEIRTTHFIVASDGGEKTALRFANEFETLLRVFQATMPNARLTNGIPVRLLVARDGQSFARMAPEFPFDKKRDQPPALMASGTEKTYIGIRANVGGHFPFADIFKTYAHDVVKRSYRNLPPWLEEGFSNIYAGITFTDHGVRMERPDPEDLSVLFESPLLPLDLVFKVDRNSPFYSPGNSQSVYLAESRVLVHFFVVDPQFSGSKSMERYIAAVQGGTDSLQAARDAFGDLTQLQTKFEAFVNQTKGVPTDLPISGGNESGGAPRTLSAAEFEARRSDFLSLRGRMDDAQGDLEEAITTEPSLAEAEQSLGFLLLKKRNLDDAEIHFQKAVQLDSKDALNFYGLGLVEMAKSGISDQPATAIKALEKAAELNPDFAETWYNLALIYSQKDETLQKALAASQHATSLAPGNSNYQLQMASIQNELGHPEDARKTAAMVQGSTGDKNTAKKAADLVARAGIPPPPTPARANPDAIKVTSAPPPPPPASKAPAPKSEPNAAPPAAPAPVAAQATPLFSEAKIYSMVGTITEVTCTSASEIQLTLKSLTILMKLHALDVAKLSVKSASAEIPSKISSCTSLRGRCVRISYNLVLDKPWDGEMQEVELRN